MKNLKVAGALASLLLTCSAQALILSYDFGLVGAGRLAEVSSSDAILRPFLSIGGGGGQDFGAVLFADAVFTGDDEGQTFRWEASPGADADYAEALSLLTNGVDDNVVLYAERDGGLAGATVGSLRTESQIFSDLLPGSTAVDLSNFVINGVALTVSDIDFQPYDGTASILFWRGTIEFDVTPVPVPAAGVLMVCALATLPFGRGKRQC